MFGLEYILYLDESSKIISGEHLFCVGGIIIDRKEYEENAISGMIKIKNKFWNNKDVVLHYSKMLRNAGEFSILKDFKIRGNFWNDIRQYVQNLNCCVVGAYINNTLFGQLFDNKNLPYHACVYDIINTYIYFLHEHKSQGSIVFESRNGTDNKTIWNIFDNILSNGTNLFDKESVNKHLTTIGFVNKKENNCGLQIADIVPYKLLESLDEKQKDSYNLRKTILAKRLKAKNGSDCFSFRKIF